MAASFKTRDKSHARIYGHWEHLPAWNALSVYGRAILTIMLMDYRAGQNFIILSDAEAARRANCARATAAKAIEELQELGWIKVARVGKIRGRKATRASAYYLTMYPEEIGIPATHDYKKWRPNPTA
ncbi:MAG: hypothetical protein GY751_09325 [Bacteroidetes bacterium]|nr:hypothetical protein [Bacteroidota bacterium]